MLEPSFHIREIPIYGDVILSPMDGYSDLPFRSVCRTLGSAMSYTEFVNVDELQGRHGGSRRTQQKLVFDPAERPISFQIYGHDVDRIVRTAVRLQELQPDIIDINMGCYVKNISERGAGAGMLRFPDRVAQLFSTLSRELQVPVTAKMRIGWDDNQRNYLEIAQIVAGCGASALAVHGRTRAQAYKGAADWDAIAEIRQQLHIPVLGNGDVRSPADIRRMQQHTGCAAVLIGRGAIGNPWIFQHKAAESVNTAEKIALVRRHLALNQQFYGAAAGLVLFRKHVAHYLQHTARGESLRLALLTCEHTADFEALIESLGSAQPVAVPA